MRSLFTFVTVATLWLVPSTRADDKPEPKKEAKPLFDGKSLKGWKIAKFGGEGEVEVKDGAVIIGRGEPMTGIAWEGKDFPKMNYEVTLEGKKLLGNDFFCTTTFPVGDAFCSLVVGGWGGTVVGLSSIDGLDASENQTNTTKSFDKDRWYKVKIRVTKDRIQAWIDDKSVVDCETKDRKISIRPECDLCRPFGIATYRTTGAIRSITLRSLTAADNPKK